MQSDLAKKNALLDHASVLNQQLESSYLGLALVLVEIEETEAFKEAGYEFFGAYCQDELGREKSTVSRLLKVGKWIRDNKVELPVGNLSYKRLDRAITQNPDKDPEYILAVAETWKPSDFSAENRDRCKTHEFVMKCKHCGMYEEHV